GQAHGATLLLEVSPTDRVRATGEFVGGGRIRRDPGGGLLTPPMDFLQPTTWADALDAKAEHPDAVPIAGGTDLMVGLNFGQAPPPALLDLTAVPEIAQWERNNGTIRIGAGMTYHQI